MGSIFLGIKQAAHLWWILRDLPRKKTVFWLGWYYFMTTFACKDCEKRWVMLCVVCVFLATGVGMTGPTPKINAFTSSKENCEGVGEGYGGMIVSFWGSFLTGANC